MELKKEDLQTGKVIRKVAYFKGKKHLVKIKVLTIQSWRKISKQDQKYPHTKFD